MAESVDNNKETQEFYFDIKFNGNNSIPIDTLAKTLKELNTLFCKAGEPGVSYQYYIEANKKGSFVLEFYGVAEYDNNLVNQNKSYFLESINSVNDWVSIHKHLKGNPVKSIHKENNKTVIINSNNEILELSSSRLDYFKDRAIQNSISSIAKQLEFSKREGLTILDKNNNKLISVGKEDFSILQKQIDILKEQKISSVENVLLLVNSVVFSGNTYWNFNKENRKINAKIEDEEWLNEFYNSKVSFVKGTRLDVKLRTEYELDDNAQPIFTSLKYFIEKVNSTIFPFDMKSNQFSFLERNE